MDARRTYVLKPDGSWRAVGTFPDGIGAIAIAVGAGIVAGLFIVLILAA